MANFTQIDKPINIVSLSASVDYRAVGETGRGYGSIEDALEYLGEDGIDCIVAGLHFFVRNTDGSVKEYCFVTDGGEYVEIIHNNNSSNMSAITNSEIDSIINN